MKDDDYSEADVGRCEWGNISEIVLSTFSAGSSRVLSFLAWTGLLRPRTGTAPPMIRNYLLSALIQQRTNAAVVGLSAKCQLRPFALHVGQVVSATARTDGVSPLR
jgi:hypothetical protein